MRLFVYGSLLSSFHNFHAHLLHTTGHFCGIAYISGRLYHVGAYPGAVLSTLAKEKVWGEIYQINSSILSKLDHYEAYSPEHPDSEYLRQQTIAYTTDGSQIPVWIYTYNRPVSEPLRILTGSWATYIKSN